MPSQGKYPDELRERAVRMVLDHEDEYGSQWEAICSVAEKLGPKAETVRLWVRRAEADEGRRPGPTSDQLAELKRLKRENAELRRRPGTDHPWTLIAPGAVTELTRITGIGLNRPTPEQKAHADRR